MGVAQDVEPQPGQQRWIALHLRVLQDAGQQRVGDDLFDKAIPPVGSGIGDTIAQSFWRQPLGRGHEIVLLLVQEVHAIGDQVLKVPQLRTIHGRIVDLGENAVPHREPDAARGGVGRPDGLLVPMSPAGLDARSPKRLLRAHSSLPCVVRGVPRR